MKVYQMKSAAAIYRFGGMLRFNFHAKNQKDADAKVSSWMRYQGYSEKSPHVAVLAPDQTVATAIHDEWIPD